MPFIAYRHTEHAYSVYTLCRMRHARRVPWASARASVRRGADVGAHGGPGPAVRNAARSRAGGHRERAAGSAAIGCVAARRLQPRRRRAAAPPRARLPAPGRPCHRAGRARARWVATVPQAAQRSADRSARRLVQRRRRAAPAARWAAWHGLLMGARRPHTPAWSLRSRAARAVGRPPRASAAHPTRLPLGCGGRPAGKLGPPPTRRRRRARLQPLCGFRLLRAAPAHPSAPRGSQEAENPSPARLGDQCSSGAGFQRSRPSPALRSGWRSAPALTAPTPLLAQFLPPGRKTGLGQGARRAPVALPLVAT